MVLIPTDKKQMYVVHYLDGMDVQYIHFDTE